MKMHSSLATVLALALPMAVTQSTRAAFITEYFNGYGAVIVSISGLGNSGGGWAGAWSGNTSPQYAPSTTYTKDLLYANPQYDNTQNPQGSSDGFVRRKEGGSNTFGNTVTRQFSSGLGGTIWVSATALASGTAGETALWLDLADTYVALRKKTVIQPVVRINGVEDSSNATNYTGHVVNLFVVRIGIDVGGSNDMLEFWVKRANEDISSPAALGTPLYTISGADIFGSTFDGIGVSFSVNGSRIDAIRVSNDADAFRKVVSAAESETGTVITVR